VTLEKFRQIQGDLRARDIEVERAVAAKFAAKEAIIRREATAAATAAVTAKLAKAEREKKAAEAKIKGADAATKRALEAQRVALEKAADERVAAEREKRAIELQKHGQELEALRRRVAKERPMDLGDEAELDLLALLARTAEENSWSLDEFTRIGKGKAGGDILHRVMLPNGVAAGAILFESKNTSVFQTKWTAKAKADQLSVGADHAILVTTAWPAGERDLMVRDSVLVVSKARLAAVTAWVRAQVVRSHGLKLSASQRSSKAERLYSFMCSDKVQDRWDRMAQTMTRMKDALRAERTQHEKLWSDRTDQMGVLNTIRESFIADLDGIFESTDAAEVAP
jgi:hypothetical protein